MVYTTVVVEIKRTTGLEKSGFFKVISSETKENNGYHHYFYYS